MRKKLKKWVKRGGDPQKERGLKLGSIAEYRGIPVKIIGIREHKDKKVYTFRNLAARKGEDLFFSVAFKKRKKN